MEAAAESVGRREMMDAADNTEVREKVLVQQPRVEEKERKEEARNRIGSRTAAG